MATTKYKGTTSYKDPVTGSIYVDRQSNTYQPQTKAATSMIPASTQGVINSKTNNPVMGSAEIYPGSLHGQTPETKNLVTYNGNDAPGPGWTGNQSTFYSKARPERAAFSTGPVTDEYYDLMKDTEGSKPADFESRYEGAIQSILDGILNKKSFNLETDANYNLLYNQAREKYLSAGDKAMRDTMGAMQAQTGGYGSTAATIAGSQAYDNYLAGLNDQNTALAQLAYQMYGDEVADRYNQLGAVTGLDNTDYARYRDTVSDWMADRDYYANMYNKMYGYDWDQYRFNTDMDEQTYQYDNNLAYQMSRDALSDYDDAFNKAYQLAAAGQKIPERYASFLEYDTLASLNALAAQVEAAKAGSNGGSGGGGGRSGGGSGGGYPTTQSTGGIDWEDVVALYRKGQQTGDKNDKKLAADALKELQATRPDQVQYYKAALKNSGR